MASQSYLGRKAEGEANIEENKEDESSQLLPKLVVILTVGKLVGVLEFGKYRMRIEYLNPTTFINR